MLVRLIFVLSVLYCLEEGNAFQGTRNIFGNKMQIRTNLKEKDSLDLSNYVPIPERCNTLKKLLAQEELSLMPCCYDGLSAKLIERAGFNVTFMTGFGVSGALGFPDTGLLTASEMEAQARVITSSLQTIPCIGDGDTGYGNVANVQRTLINYAQAGLSGIMLEDQVMPKRCGHTAGKEVVSREEAFRRIKAAVDIRNELNLDIVILARTDARLHSLDEAIYRCQKFRELGVDWTFLEAPRSIEEMTTYCQSVDGPKLANMLEHGHTPILTPKELQDIGYKIAAYPLTLLSASAKAIQETLIKIKHGQSTNEHILSFEELKDVVGFPNYYDLIAKY